MFFCGTTTTPPNHDLLIHGFLDHTQRHTTFSRTYLDEWSAVRGDLFLTSHNTTTHRYPCTPGGIRTKDPRRRTAAGLRLWSRRHWDRYLFHKQELIFYHRLVSQYVRYFCNFMTSPSVTWLYDEQYVRVTVVLRLLALAPLANTQQFLIYALSFLF